MNNLKEELAKKDESTAKEQKVILLEMNIDVITRGHH
jgi:hypothetical protein